MKKTIIKRLIYTDGNGHERIGGYPYDGHLSDESILNAIHEVGKTQWIGSNLYLMRNKIPVYRISTMTCTQYERSWYDFILDALRRV